MGALCSRVDICLGTLKAAQKAEGQSYVSKVCVKVKHQLTFDDVWLNATVFPLARDFGPPLLRGLAAVHYLMRAAHTCGYITS